MDTGKLLKVIADILEEEQSGKIQSVLQNIVSYYEANDATSINSAKEQIYTTVTTSRISEYAFSDYNVLERLQVTSLFGPGLFQRLNETLSSQAHEIASMLRKLVTEREQALTSLKALQGGLADFNLESRSLDSNNYEIGFVLPESYSDMLKTEKALEDFRLFLDGLANAVGEQQPLRIKYVSNGSLEFFIDAGIELAQKFDIVMEYALKIYEVVSFYKAIKDSHAGYSKERKKEADKLAEDEKKEKSSLLVDELIQMLEIDNHDDKNRVSGQFKTLLAHIEAGVSAEVHTPKIPPPTEPASEATKAEVKAYQADLKVYEAKRAIDTRNRVIFQLQQNNFYGMDTKFLGDITDTSENSTTEQSPD